jgi:hypothetical protein
VRGLLGRCARWTAGRAQKITAVFAVAPEDCDSAVRHVAQGAVALPIWLFTTRPPLPDTAALCDRVTVEPRALRLVLRALLSLRPYWVALSVTAWTGKRESQFLKFAPFLIPPFRVLVMNEHQGFFSGNPRLVSRHLRRRIWAHTRDAALWIWDRFVIAGYFLLLAWGRFVALCHRVFWPCVHLVGRFVAAYHHAYWVCFHSVATLGCALSTWRYRVRGLGLLLVAALARRSTSFARFLLARHGDERFTCPGLVRFRRRRRLFRIQPAANGLGTAQEVGGNLSMPLDPVTGERHRGGACRGHVSIVCGPAYLRRIPPSWRAALEAETAFPGSLPDAAKGRGLSSPCTGFRLHSCGSQEIA